MSDLPDEKPAKFSKIKVFSYFFFLFILFNLNLRSFNSEDIQALKYLPFSLAQEGNLDFDEFPSLSPSYRLIEINGHQLSTFPIGTALLATPLYVPFIWCGVQPGETSAAILAKLSASLMVTISCFFLFLVLRRDGETSAYFAITIYALGSGLFSILAQDLESQTASLLCHSLILYFLFSTHKKKFFWIGIFIGLSFAFRQSNLISMAVLSLIILKLNGKKPFLLIGLGASCAYLPHLALNLWLYGHFLGGYAANHQLWGFRMNPASGFYFSHPIWLGIAGLLLSPSRGILIYSPWLLFFWKGYQERWKTGGIERWLILPLIAHLLFYASFWNWPGGVHYGGRFLLETLPYGVFLMYPAFKEASKSLWITGVFAITIHTLGAFAYDNAGPNSWDITPIHTMHKPSRFWEIQDCQIIRTLKNTVYAPSLFGFPNLKERSHLVQKYEKDTIRFFATKLRLALAQNNLSSAEQFLVAAKQWGETDELYELEGQLYLKKGQKNKALLAFEKGYWFSQHLPCLIQASHLYRQLKRFQEGEALLLEAKKRLTLFYQPSYLLGLLWKEAQQSQKAIQAFQEALQIRPERAEISISLGVLKFEQGLFSENLTFLETIPFKLTKQNKNILAYNLQSSNFYQQLWAASLLYKLGNNEAKAIINNASQNSIMEVRQFAQKLLKTGYKK